MINLMEIFMKNKDEFFDSEIINGILSSLYRIIFQMTFNSKEIQ